MGWENCWVDFEKKNSKELSSMESSCTAAGHFDAGCFFSFLNLEKICFDNDYYFFFGHMVPNEIKENLVGLLFCFFSRFSKP